MDSLTSSVAAAVKAAIDESGLSLVQVSDGAGIPRTTLIRRLSGATSLTLAELEAVASALDVPVTDFLKPDAA